MPTKLCGAIGALIVLACLPATARIQAEERDANLRRQALKLNEITGTEARLAEQERLLKDKAQAKKLVAEAVRMAGEKPQPFTYNATFILGSLAESKKVKNYAAAETFWRLHREQAKQLHSSKGTIAAYMGLIRSTYATRKFAETEKLCKEARADEIVKDAIGNMPRGNDEEAVKERHDLTKFALDIIEDAAIAMARQGDVNRAIEHIDHEFQDSLLGLELKGQIYRIADKNEEALKAYDDMIDRAKSDNNLKKKDQEQILKDIDYSKSGIYIELGQLDKAEEMLKGLLAKHPDEATYNNDLGYIWADHDKNLAEAEKMIRKAIEEDRKAQQKKQPKAKPEDIKDRGSYLDSLGWVLFKQKKYVEAKRYLRLAVQNTHEDDEAESVEIYDHLGEVLLASGQKAEAVAAWKKGVEVAGESKRDQKRKEEVQKKIKANE